MSGDTLVAKRIADYDGDVAVRECLKTLFTHELETADQAMPRYKNEYEAAIRKNAPAWAGAESADGGEA